MLFRSGEELPHGGLGTEAITQVLQQAGYKTALSYAPWSRALRGTQAGIYDIVPGLWFTKERAQEFAYSDPLLENRLIVISHHRLALEFRELKDLAGLTVGIGRDYGYPEEFLTATYFTRQTANSLEQNLKKIIFDRIQVTVGDALVGRYTALTRFGDAHHIFKYSKTAIEVKKYHVGVSLNHPDRKNIIEVLNRGFAKLKSGSDLNHIIERHLRPLTDEEAEPQT